MGSGAERILSIAVAAIYGRRRLTFLVLMAFTVVMLEPVASGALEAKICCVGASKICNTGGPALLRLSV